MVQGRKGILPNVRQGINSTIILFVQKLLVVNLNVYSSTVEEFIIIALL